MNSQTKAVPPVPAQSAEERQRWLRIRLSIAAYSYEFKDDSIMSDAEFDKLSLEVNPAIRTGNPLLDDFFASDEFDPSTGSWVWSHPERQLIAGIYRKYWKDKSR